MSHDSIFSAQLSHLRRSRSIASRAASDADVEEANQAAAAAALLSPRGNYQPSSRSVPSTPVRSSHDQNPANIKDFNGNKNFESFNSDSHDAAESNGHFDESKLTETFRLSPFDEKHYHQNLFDPPSKKFHHTHHKSEPTNNYNNSQKQQHPQTPSPPLQSIPNTLFPSPIPPLCRSYSTTTAAHTHTQSPSQAGFSQKIPLRTLSQLPVVKDAMMNISPLFIPTSVTSPTFISPINMNNNNNSNNNNNNNNDGNKMISPPSSSSSQLSQSSLSSSNHLDGLTPATTLRTLQPLLTPATKNSSTQSNKKSNNNKHSVELSEEENNLVSMTPSSAMRMLLTGQSGNNHTQAPIQNISRRLSPNIQPSITNNDNQNKNNNDNNNGINKLLSPLQLPSLNINSNLDSPSSLIPSLIRSSTTDQTSPSVLTTLNNNQNNKIHTPIKSSSQRNIFNVSDFSLTSNILNGEIDDSDDEDDEEDNNNNNNNNQLKPQASEQTASIIFPLQHSPILQKILSFLPFSFKSQKFLHRIESFYAICITLSLFIALFSDSIRLAIIPKMYDKFIAILLGLIALLLGSECFFFFFNNNSYRWTFESLLDIFSVFSLIPQIFAIYYEIPLTRLQIALMMMMRAGVMVRLVGLLRLIPIRTFNQWTCGRKGRKITKKFKKLFQSIFNARQINSNNNDNSDSDDSDDDNENNNNINDNPSIFPSSHASRIGQMLSDYTAHRVVLGVFIILLVYNYFHPNIIKTIHPFAINHLNSLMDGEIQSDPSLTQSLIQNYEFGESGSDLIYFTMNNITLINKIDLLKLLRKNEIETIITSHYNASINIKSYSQSFALFDCWCLLMMLILCPLLLCLIFDDVHTVIYPIERMVKFVANLAKDPLTEIAPYHSANIQQQTNSILKKRKNKLHRHSLLPQPDYLQYLPENYKHQNDSENNQGNVENSLLSASNNNFNDNNLSSTFSSSQFPLDSLFVELTLQKLAILLQLVFGSAGANIIANNIKGDYLEVQVPGKKIYGIFSFITLNSYSDIVLNLEQQASTLTNDLSELIHSLCVLFGGEINKNIGNSWLLVWKLEAADKQEKEKAKQERKASLSNLNNHNNMINPNNNNGNSITNNQPKLLIDNQQNSNENQILLPSSQPEPEPPTPTRILMNSMELPAIPVLKPSSSFPSQLSLAEPISPIKTPPKTKVTTTPTEIPGTTSNSLPSPLSLTSITPKNESSFPDRVYSHVTDISPINNNNNKYNNIPSGLRRRTLTSIDSSTIQGEEEQNNNKNSFILTTPPSTAKSSRRDSLIDSMKKLGQKARGSFFSSSTKKLFGIENQINQQENNDENNNASENNDSNNNKSINNSQSPSNDNESSSSFYNRTLPAQPLHRHQHGWKQNAENSRIAEQALSSFLLTIVQLSTSPSLIKWRQHELLLKSNLSLTYGIGLHVGWAIEGAIGSAHKIDASYLSPNVNLCSRLSSLCHYYHTPLLFSSTLFSLLGVEVQKRCRKIDVVSVKGSRRPIGIYTFDIDYGDLHQAELHRERLSMENSSSSTQNNNSNNNSFNSHQSYDERMRKKQVNEINEIMIVLRQAEKSTQQIVKNHFQGNEGNNKINKKEKNSSSSKTDDETETDEEEENDSSSNNDNNLLTTKKSTRRSRRASTGSLGANKSNGGSMKRSSSSDSLTFHSPLLPSLTELLTLLQSNIPHSFIPLFNAASSCYIDGDWRSAGRLLVRVLTLKPSDGPSQLLLKVMAQHGFRAPTGWKGFRQLNKK